MVSKNRSSLIRLASTLPKGSEERRAILAGLKRAFDEAKFDRELTRLMAKHMVYAELDDVHDEERAFIDAIGMAEDMAREKEEGTRYAAPKTAFNKENPSDLLSQLVKVLKKYELIDAASRVNGIAKVVQTAWNERER